MIRGVHREGKPIIIAAALVFAGISALCFAFVSGIASLVAASVLLLLLLFLICFFRVPGRKVHIEDGLVYAPADGTVVVVERTEEREYLGKECIQVSVFMSIWNIHINWFPVGGRVVYFKYHPGRHLVAWHPKSSENNERTTVAVDTGREKILFRQIAGMVARRIVSYAAEGAEVRQNSQCGFIKFGSRVDVFLPPDSEICVSLGEKVVGTQTVIARLKR